MPYIALNPNEHSVPQNSEDDSSSDESEDGDAWYIDRTGLQFSFPPADMTDQRWLDSMIEQVEMNTRALDSGFSVLLRIFETRLSDATLLQVEGEAALQEYEELLADVSNNMGFETAWKLFQMARYTFVPRYDEDGNIEMHEPPARDDEDHPSEDALVNKDVHINVQEP